MPYTLYPTGLHPMPYTQQAYILCPIPYRPTLDALYTYTCGRDSALCTFKDSGLAPRQSTRTCKDVLSEASELPRMNGGGPAPPCEADGCALLRSSSLGPSMRARRESVSRSRSPTCCSLQAGGGGGHASWGAGRTPFDVHHRRRHMVHGTFHLRPTFKP